MTNVNDKKIKELISEQILQNYLSENEITSLYNFAKATKLTLVDFAAGRVYSKYKYSMAKIKQVINVTSSLLDVAIADKVVPELPQYEASAGAPCSGKTTLLNQLITEEKYKNHVYIDPDITCLQEFLRIKDDSENLYNDYRDASNFAANIILAVAIIKKLSILHGTTLTNTRFIEKVLNYIQEQFKYKININLCIATKDARIAGYKNRMNSNNLNVTIEDFDKKYNKSFLAIRNYKDANSLSLFITTYEEQKFNRSLTLDANRTNKSWVVNIVNKDTYKMLLPILLDLSEEYDREFLLNSYKNIKSLEDKRKSSEEVSQENDRQTYKKAKFRL